MQIDIKARDFSLAWAKQSHAERRLRFSLTCCDDHIELVVMRLYGINGARGGVDKRCHIRMVLTNLPDVVVEDTEANLYVAIDRATDRARRTLLRKVHRQQTMLTQGVTRSYRKRSSQSA